MTSVRTRGWRLLVGLPLMAAASWQIAIGIVTDHEILESRLSAECQRHVAGAMPEWLASDVDGKFALYRHRFGALERITQPTGKVTVDGRGGLDERIGVYSAAVRFQNGHADVVVKLVKHGESWEVQNLTVRSPLLPSAE